MRPQPRSTNQCLFHSWRIHHSLYLHICYYWLLLLFNHCKLFQRENRVLKQDRWYEFNFLASYRAQGETMIEDLIDILRKIFLRSARLKRDNNCKSRNRSLWWRTLLNPCFINQPFLMFNKSSAGRSTLSSEVGEYRMPEMSRPHPSGSPLTCRRIINEFLLLWSFQRSITIIV